MSKKLLIWDIDGTLIDCMGSGRRAMDKTFHKLFGIENGFQNIKMAGRLDWQIVNDAIKHHSIENFDIDIFFKEYEKILKDELKSNQCGKILPGILEILENTSGKENIYHVLGTGNCQEGAKLKLSHLGIDTYFKLGGFGNNNLKRWQMIEKVIREAKEYFNVNFSPKDIYVIGDTVFDIECGKKLGVKSIAVATGSCEYEVLAKSSPDYIFKNFERASEFINFICNI